MKIAYDDQIFGRQVVGGISRYILEVASRLKRQGPDMDVLTCSGLAINALLPEYDVGNIGIRVKSQKGYRPRNLINQGLSELVLQVYRPDVIHETYYRASCIGPTRARRVLTVHDMIHELMPDETSWAKEEAEWKAKAIARCDGIVCVSEATKTDLLKVFPSLDKQKPITVIHHGCSSKPPQEAFLKKVDDLVGGSPFILFVGQRAGYKRFMDLVNAYVAIKANSSYKLVAFGGGAFSSDELAEMHRLGVQDGDVIQYSGSDALLDATYSRCKVFVYPSLYEGFGIPILEALAGQCHVLCSDIEVFREIGRSNVSYFQPGDVEDLHKKLYEKVNGSPQDGILSWSKNNWNTSAGAHLNFYMQICNAA